MAIDFQDELTVKQIGEMVAGEIRKRLSPRDSVELIKMFTDSMEKDVLGANIAMMGAESYANNKVLIVIVNQYIDKGNEKL